MTNSLREFVVYFSIEFAARRRLPHAAPLLEKEGQAFAPALIPDLDDPFLLHRSCSGAALSSHDHPIDSTKIEFAQILQ